MCKIFSRGSKGVSSLRKARIKLSNLVLDFKVKNLTKSIAVIYTGANRHFLAF